jgi:hypothetical protein
MRGMPLCRCAVFMLLAVLAMLMPGRGWAGTSPDVGADAPAITTAAAAALSREATSCARADSFAAPLPVGTQLMLIVAPDAWQRWALIAPEFEPITARGPPLESEKSHSRDLTVFVEIYVVGDASNSLVCRGVAHVPVTMLREGIHFGVMDTFEGDRSEYDGSNEVVESVESDFFLEQQDNLIPDSQLISSYTSARNLYSYSQNPPNRVDPSGMADTNLISISKANSISQSTRATTSVAVNIGARGAARGVAKVIASNLHHAWPKYLGGPVKQILAKMTPRMHKLFHKQLDKFLPRWKSKKYYDSLSARERAEIVDKLVDITIKFDKANGTRIMMSFIETAFKFL